MTMETFLGLYNYWIVIFLMMTGFYIVIARGNLIKTIIGLNIFQTSVFLLYITMGKVTGGIAPIVSESDGHGAENHDAGHEHDAVNSAAEHAFNGSGAFESGAETATESGEFESGIETGVDSWVQTVGYDEPIADGVAGHANDAISEVVYSNPLPSVLMLTAIVVGIATTALALALVVRIREEYGTIEEDEILEMDRNS